MSSARFLVGDVFDRMATLEDGSIDLVLTSPPFLALRSYLPVGHPDKAKEIGSEPTPAEFLDTLLALTAEWRRLLAPHGSIAVELGDTYAGGGGGPDARYEAKDASTLYDPAKRGTHTTGGWPMDKSLCGIPHLYHLSLAYGRNLLTAEPSPAGSWRIRNVVAWCRPNPPVGALGDKFRPATSYMTVACTERVRYFDLDAVRGNPEDVKDQRRRFTNGPKQDADPAEVLTANYHHRVPSHVGGPPPLDWWSIPTHAYPGAHYATWPPALLEKPIKAMVPRQVCTTCGEPSRRIAETTNAVGHAVARAAHRNGATGRERDVPSVNTAPELTERQTIGWTDCGHDTWRNGLVLDPFAGSGTTLAVATGHGRDAIGIDLDERNADLARERVGMFLTVEHPERVA